MASAKAQRQAPQAPRAPEAEEVGEASVGPAEVQAIEAEVKTTQKATITRILKGRLADFIPAQKLKRQETADRVAFKVYFRAEDGREGSFIVSFTLNRNSTLRRFIAKYGRAPYVGQVIDVTENERGFLKPIL